MIRSSELRLASSVAAITAFIEPHRQWIENVIGCSWSESVTFEADVPFGQIVAEDLLTGVTLDRQCLLAADAVRPTTVRWELLPGESPKIELIHSREQDSPITAKQYAWDPHWKETPVALWLKGLNHALVSASIPYVSFRNGMQEERKTWLVANRTEIVPALNLLNKVLIERPKKVTVVGGADIPLPRTQTDWDCLALDTRILELVKRDLEFFFQREAWFKRSLLPFRRGYLFYGPPGNGKTSVVRVMAIMTNSGVRAVWRKGPKPGMARGDQLTRQWALVRLLSGRHGRTLAQLRAELGVGKRTVQRDIAALESAGFPVASEACNGTIRWHFMEGFHVEAPLSLTLTEQMALYFSKGLFQPLQDTPIYESLQSALQKVGASLPPQTFQFLRGLDQAISVRTVGFKDYSRSKDVINVLTRSVLHKFTTRRVPSRD